MLLDWTWPSSSPFHHAQHMRCLCDHEAARHWQCKACFVSGSKYCSGLSAQSKQTGERESKRVSLSAAPHFRWTLDGGREVRKQRRKTVEEQTEKVIKTSSRPFPQIREGMNKIPWSPACLARAPHTICFNSEGVKARHVPKKHSEAMFKVLPEISFL